MTQVECAREVDVMRAVVSGGWPDADHELRAHAGSCATCRDVALVAPSLRDEYLTMYRSVQVPAAGQVWWRAAVRARLETAEHAARPMTWMQGLAGAGTAGLLVALVGLAWPSVLGYAGWAFTSLLSRTAVDPQLSALVLGLMRHTFPLLIVVALCILIAPVAVYLATSDD